METKRFFIHALISLIILLIVTPALAFAQDQPATRRFGQEELDQMLAPIALYPDSLLAQILMASTYPLEVVQAERWAKANKHLTGDQLNDALDQKDWDPSVKALVPFPQVLSMMSEKLEWTQKLGDAFLDQEEEVMDTIQRLREKAQAAGNLRDTEQQRVIVQERIIEIVPVQPEVIYVPVYDPMVIYGPWWYPAFPPFFFPPPPGVIIVRGFGFWRGIPVGRSWGYAWGHWDWRRRHIYVNTNRHININRHISTHRADIQTTRWQHDVRHRRGVSYRSEAAQERYRRPPTGAERRREFRGFGQERRYQQPLGATRRGPDMTKGGQGPATPRQDIPKTRGGQPQVTKPQALEQRKGSGALDQRSLELSRDRGPFGGVGQGSDARIQRNRGFQSRQSMSSEGKGGASRDGAGRRR